MTPAFAVVTIESIDGGAAVEQINHVLAKVWANVQDPNTDPSAKRAVTLKIVITPNEERDQAQFKYSVDMKVPGPRPRAAAVWMAEQNGQPIAMTRDLQQHDLLEQPPADVTPFSARKAGAQ